MLFHIYFLAKFTVEEGHFNIQLKKLKILDNNDSEKKPKNSYLDYRQEDFVEIDSILLSESLCDYFGFVLRTSRIGGLFETEDRDRNSMVRSSTVCMSDLLKKIFALRMICQLSGSQSWYPKLSSGP